jgi:hypothetical protein
MASVASMVAAGSPVRGQTMTPAQDEDEEQSEENHVVPQQQSSSSSSSSSSSVSALAAPTTEPELQLDTETLLASHPRLLLFREACARAALDFQVGTEMLLLGHVLRATEGWTTDKLTGLMTSRFCRCVIYEMSLPHILTIDVSICFVEMNIAVNQFQRHGDWAELMHSLKSVMGL